MPAGKMFAVMMCVWFASGSLFGQGSVPFESGRDDQAPLTTRARISEGSLEFERFVPQTVEEEQVFQVDVPVVEQVEEGGETKNVTRTVKETRVRLVQVTRVVTETVSVDLTRVKFSTTSGVKMEDPEIVAKLLEEMRPVLFVFNDKPVSPYHAQFYSKRLVVIYIPQPQEDSAEGDHVDDDGQDEQ